MMHWLPAADDFRGDLRAALKTAATSDRLEKLARLAEHRLRFLETIQLSHAIEQLGSDKQASLSRIRLAILSSSTVDQLIPGLRVAGLRRRLLFDVHVGPYGQYRQQLLDEDSPLRAFRPDFVLLSVSAREAIALTPLTATSSEVDDSINRMIEELALLWSKARKNFGATVIQQTFLNVAEPLFGSFDRLVPSAPAQVIDRLNDHLAAVAAREGVLLLDIARASERDGLDSWFDVARWLQGKLEIAPQAAFMYGELALRIIAAERGLSKKCLVLDLDNTIWGGVAGEVGAEGIVLGEGTAAGEAYLAVQRYAKRLAERGVILAVCSKNDPAVAEKVFREHPDMILKRCDIAAFVANWDDKATNLERIASQLNIGIDSLVFVDDNPAERARIRQSLPSVAVPELPADASRYVRCLADAGYFEATAFTAEDRVRSEQYAANASRESVQRASESLDDFLRGLDMLVVSGPFRTVDLARIAQLINKTNQFNPTTRRYSLDEVARFAACDRCLTLQFRLVDRFGDSGIVSAMILRPDDAKRDTFEIDTWVMSCRVFGRELEYEVMNIAVETVRAAGARTLVAAYFPTPKNRVVKDLYSNLGFNALPCSESVPGSTRWSLDIAHYTARATHVARRTDWS
jgi:FkbH-like protein